MNTNSAKAYLIDIYGRNSAVSYEGFLLYRPTGLLLAGICKAHVCKTTNPKIKESNQSCKLKNLFHVGLSTEYAPHNHVVILSPTSGIALNKLVITVAPQKLICPHGKT